MAKPINNTKELERLELLLGYGEEFFSKYHKKLSPKQEEELLNEIEEFENHHNQ